MNCRHLGELQKTSKESSNPYAQESLSENQIIVPDVFIVLFSNLSTYFEMNTHVCIGFILIFIFTLSACYF